MFLIGSLLILLHCTSALVELPERARHGQALSIFKLSGDKSSTAKSWQAQVDNFDSSNNATYAQRYFVNDQYWDRKGPVFYYIGGEGTVTSPPTGYVEEIGKSYNALLITLEHRFYGESIPNGNVESSNYKYLSVEQALADLHGFQKYYKTEIQPDSKNVKWFAFGGSYPGALSSWYRSAYPDDTVGSLSSSGVVNSIINFKEFDMSVSAAAGNECSDDIKRVNRAFEQTIMNDKEQGLQSALSLFHCDKDMSQNDFFYMIADSWSMAIQYSSKSKLCSTLQSVKEDASDEEIMKNFADFSNSYWGEDFCAGGFYNTKQLKDPLRWEVNSRSWRYQTCSQVSYFNTAPPSGSLRAQEVNLDYHLKQCAEIFGKEMFPTSVSLNEQFGGQFPKATNVFYSDFSDDPWQRASVTFPPSENQPYFLSKCDDCGHCLDLHEPTPDDPTPVQESRKEFEKYLKAWLA